MLKSRADRLNIAKRWNLRRDRAHHSRPVTKLPGKVETPGPDRSVRFQCHAEILTAGYGRHIGQADHLDRGCMWGACTITERSVTVVAPRPHCPVGFERQAVISA